MLGKRKGAPGISRPAPQTGMRSQAAQAAADLMRFWNSARERRAAPPAARGSQEPSGHKTGAGADVFLPDAEQEGESTAPVPKRQRRDSGGEQARAASDGCPKVAELEHSLPGQSVPGAAGPLRPRRARTAAAMAAVEAKRRSNAAGSASAAAAGGAGRVAPAERLPSPRGPQQRGNGAKAEADVAWLHRRQQPAQVRLRRAALSLDFITLVQPMLVQPFRLHVCNFLARRRLASHRGKGHTHCLYRMACSAFSSVWSNTCYAHRKCRAN